MGVYFVCSEGGGVWECISCVLREEVWCVGVYFVCSEGGCVVFSVFQKNLWLPPKCLKFKATTGLTQKCLHFRHTLCKRLLSLTDWKIYH